MIVKANTYPADLRVNMRGGEGTASVTPILQENLPKNCRLFAKIELPQGASVGYHKHEGECEIFYFLQGEGRVQDDDEMKDVRPGDTMTTASGHSHAVFNTGSTPLVFIASIVLTD